jgi:hypothetical protein
MYEEYWTVTTDQSDIPGSLSGCVTISYVSEEWDEVSIIDT